MRDFLVREKLVMAQEQHLAVVQWHLRHPATRPSPRSFVAMAYDATRARTVLYGGLEPTRTLGDTWEWDGTNWVQRFPPRVRRRARGTR